MEVTKFWHQASELEHVHRAGDVYMQRELARDGKVVNRSEMKDSRRLFPHFSGIERR